MGEIKLLDCTLRDGGYINDWEFGKNNIINVFERLVSAGIDIIEIGFLDERRQFDENRTIMPDAASVNHIYGGLDKGDSIVVGMIDYGTCSIDRLIPCEESFMDGIRVIFKKQVMHEAMAFCKQVKSLGYKVFSQAVSITSYNDEELAELIELVNEVGSYAFSLVDTYGLLHKEQLMHYYNFADKHLKPEIGIGYHAHNNFQLAYANCVELLENPPKERMLLVDGSLHGMGKAAGNAPVELLAMYMNDNLNKKYDNSQLLEAIDVTILDIYHKTPWGYSLKFYMAASNDCHPNYVTYLMDKKKLSIKSINEILNQIEYKKKLLYDEFYIEQLYREYQKIACDDRNAIEELTRAFTEKKILLLGPGNHIVDERPIVEEYIEKEEPVVISINFMPEEYLVNYIFISNAKRYVQLSSKISTIENGTKIIATSNLTKAKGNFNYSIQYSSLLDEEALIVDNPMIMLIKLLLQMKVKHIALAGFDGYSKKLAPDYINPNMEHSFSKEKALEINEDVRNSLRKLSCKDKMSYITTTFY